MLIRDVLSVCELHGVKKWGITVADLFVNVVEPRAAKQFAGFGGITAASVRAEAEGIVVVFRVNGAESVLGAARGGMRFFKTIDAAASAIKQLGVKEFSMNLESWVPKNATRKIDEE